MPLHNADEIIGHKNIFSSVLPERKASRNARRVPNKEKSSLYKCFFSKPNQRIIVSPAAKWIWRAICEDVQFLGGMFL
jgi:hypothetical protein